MNLNFNLELAKGYSSKSQIARVLSEDWVLTNSYCPSCGEKKLNDYPNNKPVADFYCYNCQSDFELKSSSTSFRNKILDGSYQTMIDRISSYSNPHFFFLNYSKTYTTENFIVIPNHFFSPQIIEKRKPLSRYARRAGWIGCNIVLSSLPRTSKIYVVRQGQVSPKNEVINQWNKAIFLKKNSMLARGWLINIMACIDKLPCNEFSISEIYNFESYLKKKYPKNKFIKEKIRQQLQVLRNRGYIKFLGRGKYFKL
ncbi:MAG: restriction endonuclease [Bacteroidetes bacterium]|nr:restriction endonuclease [Bacteroidota bacterium]